SWHDAWVLHVAGNLPGENRSIVINTQDVGSSQFQFAFTFEGYEGGIDHMVIDNVRLFPTAGIDLAAEAIILPEVIKPQNMIIPKAIIQNLGIDPSSYKAWFQIRNSSGTVYLDSISKTIPTGATDTLSFQNWSALEGEFTARCIVKSLLDGNPVNDTVYYSLTSYKTYSRHLVVLEEATGTWCTYCPGASMGIDDLLKNGYDVAAIAYHQGDNYQTPESQARINFYPIITGFPTVMFDGILYFIGGNHSVSEYHNYIPLVEQRMLKETPAEVTIGTTEAIGLTVTSHIDIASLSPIRNNNLKLHVVLTESHIPESWQDQDTLNLVERMMYADSSGSSVDLSNKSASVNVNLAVSSLWERKNLELVVFLQDMTTLEILNGDKKGVAILGVNNKQNPVVEIFPNPADKFVVIKNLKDATLQVFNISGNLLVTKDHLSGQSKLDISELSNGLYLFKISDKGMDMTKRISIIH
ncbi:MAG: T9SS type A sorting domain-containing protein, partial [Bacteroidota bacterium]